MKKYYSIGIAVSSIILFGLVFYSTRAPQHFPESTIVEIKKGESLDEVADLLAEEHIIKSAFMLRTAVLLLGREEGVIRGLYLFDRPQSVFTVASRITHADYGLESVKVTIPEGVSRFVIADLLQARLPAFSRKEFLQETEDKEGYLFPDTYLFSPQTTAKEAVEMLTSNYEEKVGKLRPQFLLFGKTEKEIITMASILEGEARQFTTRQVVAGILWKRLAIGMPLQVDTTFRYINGKGTFQLTAADLKINSPYNTYVYKGLPPTPISNPGITSITAAITPVKTNYLYFLTDIDGNMHYSTTFDDHVSNKREHLQ